MIFKALLNFVLNIGALHFNIGWIFWLKKYTFKNIELNYQYYVLTEYFVPFLVEFGSV